MAFLKTIWTWLVGIKDALVLILMVMLFGGLWALSPLSSPGKSVPKGAALAIDLAGLLVDQPSEISVLGAVVGEQVVPETETAVLVRAINTAAKDKAIAMITLDLDGFLGGGQANLEAVGAALHRFRATGKPVTAWATSYGDDAYLLAANANRIALSPMGAVLLTGPGGRHLYFKDALDRLKVDVEVFRVGTYKSFVEPYTRNDASAPARAASQQLADDLRANWQNTVAAARPAPDHGEIIFKTPEPTAAETAAETAANTGNQAEAARKAGLVDAVESRAQWQARLVQKLGAGDTPDMPGDYKRIDFADYAAARPARSGGASVGVIHISGTIVDGESAPGQAGGTAISRLIRQAIADGEVKALVVRIDSGGGSALASDEIREALVEARAAGLPVVASFGPVAASGGYWIATGADTIIASPSTITGSIGVFGMIPTFQRSLAALGVHSDGVTTTPYSGQPDIMGGLNAPTRALIQGQVADTYRQFVQLVANARHLSPADVEAIAEGRVWSGTRALDLKLIDRFGTLDTAIEEAARRATLPADAPVKRIAPPQPLLLTILNRLSGEVSAPRSKGLANAVLAARLKAAAQIAEALSIADGPTIQAQCLGCMAWSAPVNRQPAPEPAAAAKALIGRLLPG